MQTAICLLSAVPMRKEPSHRSEMVSQLLFGDFVVWEEEKDDFVHITCLYDNYKGWVQSNQLTIVQPHEIYQTNRYTNGFVSLLVSDKGNIQIPFGSPVFGSDNLSFIISNLAYRYLMQPQQYWTELTLSEKTLQAVFTPYLNTPYLWGGKTVFGIDCSGFAQQVFKFFGKKLMRDAYLQAGQGQPVLSVEEAKLGDLSFFQNENCKITHVGIVLNNHQIVHASGKVRVDKLDKNGIYHVESDKRTHQLHSIRRFF